MEGIVNGLASVIPILPETGAVTAKNNSGPPVEVMPVPQDSFPADSVTSELLNTPYTLKLNSDGRNGGGAPGGYCPGGPAPEEGPAKEPSGGAYKLSIGDDTEPPVPPEIAQEMARAKNYEALGKLAARRAVRIIREVMPGHPAPVDTDDNAAPPGTAIIGRETPLPRGPVSAPPVFPPPSDIAPETGADKAPLIPEAGPGAPPADIDGPEPATPQPDRLPQTAAHLAVRLTASDFEAIMEMEPELRDTFMRMLGNEAAAAPEPETPARPVIPDTPPSTPGLQVLPEDKSAAPPAISPGAGQETQPAAPTVLAKPPAQAKPPVPTEPPAPPMPEAPAVQERVLMPEGPAQRAPVQAQQVQAAAPENPLPSLAAGVVRPSAPEPPAAAGSMQNLKKLKELPYALYLFGPAAEGKLIGRDTGEEKDEPKRPKPSDGNPKGFLRLSEAVRMAAVVHQIYRGGTGRFEEDTPWYRPYVRYALKNGIIKSGEFEDFNEFATRAEAAYIFAGSVPEAEFPVINRVPSVTDVDEQSGYGPAVYRLLRAGVFLPAAGGLFYPERPITRAEAAVIIGRIATPADRKRFLPGGERGR